MLLRIATRRAGLGYRFQSTTSSAVPLTLHGIDGRYATALYTAARQRNALEKVDADLKNLAGAAQKDAKFNQFLQDPTSNRVAKAKAMKALAQSQKYDPCTANFLEVLAENGRLQDLERVADGFGKMMMAHRGQVQVFVTSAKPLDADVMQQLQKILAKGQLVEAGQQVKMSNKVDPSVLGGFIVEVGDLTIDVSVKSKVQKYATLLQQQL